MLRIGTARARSFWVVIFWAHPAYESVCRNPSSLWFLKQCCCSGTVWGGVLVRRTYSKTVFSQLRYRTRNRHTRIWLLERNFDCFWAKTFFIKITLWWNYNLVTYLKRSNPMKRRNCEICRFVLSVATLFKSPEIFCVVRQSNRLLKSCYCGKKMYVTSEKAGHSFFLLCFEV